MQNIRRYLSIPLSYLLGDLLYLLSAIVPRNKKLWVFGAWGGGYFADNPKYIFNYVSENHPDIHIIWLSRNQDVIAKLNSLGKNAYHCNSLHGIWYTSRAYYGIISHGMIDLNRYACAGLRIVQTWHGIPMKPILLSDPKEETIRKRRFLQFLSYAFPFLKKDYAYSEYEVITSSSSFTSSILKKVFGEQAPITVTGSPRIDGVMIPFDSSKIMDHLGIADNPGMRVGLYIPTYRGPQEFDIIELMTQQTSVISSKLAEMGHLLYIKVHPFELHKIDQSALPGNIRIIQDTVIEGDIYSVLQRFDYLITDYSSILFDFSVLERPIFLLTADRESYLKFNGNFVFDYKDLDLPVKENWTELLKEVKKLDSGEYNGNLKRIAQTFHRWRDGSNSERVFELMRKASQ